MFSTIKRAAAAVCAVFALIAASLITTSVSAPSAGAEACSIPGGYDQAVYGAISQIAPPYPGGNWVPGNGNLNGCSDLSYVELETAGGTVSSPNQLLLFHQGYFQGTGVACNLGYQTVTSSGDWYVNVEYKYFLADEPNADPQGRAYTTFRWNGSGVEMIGELPEAVTHGQC